MNEIGNKYLKKTSLDNTNKDIIAIVDFISSAESINKMIVFSDMGLPAITGIVKELEDKFADCKGFPFNYDALNRNAPNRRNIGWMIKFVMREVGYLPVDGGLSERARIRDFAGSKYFSTSAIYSKKCEPNYKLGEITLEKINN